MWMSAWMETRSFELETRIRFKTVKKRWSGGTEIPSKSEDW